MMGFGTLALLPVLLVAATWGPSGQVHGAHANQRRLDERAARNSPKSIVCYYDSWAAERPEKGRLTADKLDGSLCTHLIYNYAHLNDQHQVEASLPKVALEQRMISKFNGLKLQHPKLKTLISVNDGSEKYGKMSADPELRAKFIASLVEFIERHEFDGAEISWRHPNDPRGVPEDKANYVTLLRELREQFQPKGLLLAATIAVGKRRVESGYDVAELAKHLDLMNLATLDYNGNWDKETGPAAPLYGSSKFDLDEKDAALNVNHSVNYLLSLGAPAEKMMLGIATYGRTWTLERPATANGFNAPTTKQAKPGPYTKNERSQGYNELCESFQAHRDEWQVRRDNEYRVPYAHRNQLWASYEDMDSVAEKAHYATAMKLGGVAITSMDTDDFSGLCHDEPYPLINSIKSALLDA